MINHLYLLAVHVQLKVRNIQCLWPKKFQKYVLIFVLIGSSNLVIDKDCRSSKDSFHGVGIIEGLKILSKVREEFKIPVVSDFSDSNWANQTGEVCDLVQIPAYLCRQTSILKAAALTRKPIHLKKGQFMSPWNMKNSVRKLENFGCNEGYPYR